jgi:biopolymer transport protein ExbD
MKKLVIGIITVSLLVIALTGLYNVWTNYQRAREAEAALANKPPMYIAEVPPEPSSGSSSADRAVVSVDDDGRLKLNSQEAGTTSNTSQLRAQLDQYFRERGDRSPGRAVLVKASRKISYAEVIKVIDAVKGADADPVGLEVADPK